MSVSSITDSALVDSNCTTFTSDLLVYRVATNADCDALATLINSSYRGEFTNEGWNNENEVVSGSRINTRKVLDMIADNKNGLLVFFGKTDHIFKGCIDLLHQPESKTVCLNTMAVRPDLQGREYGKFILSVAENYAASNWDVEYIELKVMIKDLN